MNDRSADSRGPVPRAPPARSAWRRRGGGQHASKLRVEALGEALEPGANYSNRASRRATRTPAAAATAARASRRRQRHRHRRARGASPTSASPVPDERQVRLPIVGLIVCRIGAFEGFDDRAWLFGSTTSRTSGGDQRSTAATRCSGTSRTSRAAQTPVTSSTSAALRSRPARARRSRSATGAIRQRPGRAGRGRQSPAPRSRRPRTATRR